MKKIFSFMLIIAMCISIVIPAAAISSIQLKSIKMNSNNISLNVGKTYDLKVTFTPANTTQKRLIFSTSNKKVAKIDSDGEITAVGIGKAVITVASSVNDKIVTKCNVTVKKLENVNLSFMTWGAENEKFVYNALIQGFQTKYPNVKVKNVITPAGEYDIKLSAMMAAKTASDLFQLKPENLMAMADSNKILNLEKLLANTDSADISKVWKSAIDRYRYDGNVMGTGDIWALPKDISAYAMVYNKDIFAKRGITPPTPNKPWTWAEFVANCKKLTYVDDSGKKIYGVSAYYLDCAIWSNGADYLDKTKTKIAINTPAFIEALQWNADLKLKEKVMPSTEEDTAMNFYVRWLEGGCAIAQMGPWDAPAFWNLKFKWDLMPWPAGPRTGQTAGWVGSAAYAVSASSKHPQEAFNLAAFFSTDRQSQTTIYQSGAAIPNLVDMAKNDYVKFDKAPATKQVFFDIIEKYGHRPSTEYTYNSEWLAEFNTNLTKVTNGKMTAAEYCKEEQPKMQVLLDKALKMKNDNKKK
jgi:multiple sugar transport system substrate-binding protein